MAMKNEYPKWLYKSGEEPVIVNSRQEHEAMIEWHESPEIEALEVIQEKNESKRRGRPPKVK